MLAGLKGEQGRGYYRTEQVLSKETTSIARNLVNPVTGCKLLVSDTIIDKKGLVFAVTKECEIGDATVYISYRSSIAGAAGADGATPEIGENGNWYINGVDTGKSSRGATGATGTDGQDGADGLGVPAGGTTGQVLTKLSDADNDTAWKDPSGGGAGGMSVNVTQYIDEDKKVIVIPAELMGILAEKYTQGSPVVLRATYSYLGIDTLFIYTMIAASKISGEGITLYTAVFSETKYDPDCFEAPVFVATSGTIEQYEIALYDNTTSKSRYGAVQIAFDNAYRAIALKAKQDAQGNDIAATYYKKPVNGIPETDLSADVQAKLNSGGGAKNLLKGDVTVTVADGSLNILNELGYPLGISADKSYKVTVNYDGENKDIIIKSSDWQKNETAVGAIAAINNYVRIVVFDGMSADRSINPNTSCLGIDRGGSSGSLSVVFKSITEIEETPASYKLKQVSVSSGETMSSVVDKITSAIEQELTAQSRSSAVVTVALNDLTISDAVMSGGAAGRVFLETSYMSVTSGVSQNKMVFITPLVRAVGDSTSIWGSGSWTVTVQFGKFESNIIASTGVSVGGEIDFKDLSNFVADSDATIDLIFY